MRCFTFNPPSDVNDRYYTYINYHTYELEEHVPAPEWAIFWSYVFMGSPILLLILNHFTPIPYVYIICAVNFGVGVLHLMAEVEMSWWLYIPHLIIAFAYFVFYFLSGILRFFMIFILAFMSDESFNVFVERHNQRPEGIHQYAMVLIYFASTVGCLLMATGAFIMFDAILRSSQYVYYAPKIPEYRDPTQI